MNAADQIPPRDEATAEQEADEYRQSGQEAFDVVPIPGDLGLNCIVELLLDLGAQNRV